MLEAAESGIIRSAAPNLSRPHRVQNPTPHYSLDFPKAERLADPTRAAALPCSLILCWRGRRGEHSALPCLLLSILRKSSHTEERCKTSIVKHHFTVNMSFCSCIHAEPEHCTIAQLNHSSPQHLHSFLLPSSTLPSYTLKTVNKSEKEKKKTPQFSGFLLILY